MKNVKMILPVLAFVFAIVTAFATSVSIPAYAQDQFGNCVPGSVGDECIRPSGTACTIIVNGVPKVAYATLEACEQSDEAEILYRLP